MSALKTVAGSSRLTVRASLKKILMAPHLNVQGTNNIFKYKATCVGNACTDCLASIMEY